MSVGVPMGNILAMGVCSVSLDPASVAANTTAEQTFTVTGLRVGDVAFVSKPSLEAGLGVVGTRVSAADTLAITFVNATASPINETAETWAVVWFRPEPGATSVKE